jgi:hypothetical protein
MGCCIASGARTKSSLATGNPLARRSITILHIVAYTLLYLNRHSTIHWCSFCMCFRTGTPWHRVAFPSMGVTCWRKYDLPGFYHDPTEDELMLSQEMLLVSYLTLHFLNEEHRCFSSSLLVTTESPPTARLLLLGAPRQGRHRQPLPVVS